MRLEASARSMALLCACGVLLEILAGPARAAGFDINTFANAFTPAGGNAITLAKPTGVAADADGNVYVADSGNCVVWEFPSGGAPPTVVAGQLGNCAGSPSSSNPATDTLDHPVDVAVCNKVIFIADTVSSGTSALHKVAGGIFSNIPFSAAPVLKANGNLQPQAITCDQTGDIFVESIYFAQDGDAYQYSLDTVSASGISSNIYAEFDTEYQGVAVDALGNAYTVRGNPAAAVIAKFIPTGSGTKVVWQEQTLTQSRSLVGATRLALDSAGNFYVPEAPPGASPLSTPSAPVYVTQLSPGVGGGYGVTYIAGNGTAGYSGDGGPALLAELNDDNGIGIATAGTALYVADTNNDRIRELYQLATGPSALVANDRIPNFSLDTAVNPQTDRLYVAVSRGNYTEGGPFEDIVVYNTVDDTVVANIPTTSAAPVSFLTIDTVNDFVYASNQDGTVAVIDGATNTLDALLTVGSNPTGIAVDPGLNTAYVANSTDSFISVIHGPVRTSGVITAPAYTLSSENISGVIPLGPIGVYPGTHTVYAVTAGPANPGSETYTLTTINGATYTVTSNLAYLSNAGSTSVAPNALAVDGANGLVVIADAEDQAAHVYNPVTAGLQSYSESFYPAAVAIDSTSGFAYVSSGYGNVSEVNLQTGAQSTVYPPAGSAPVTSCGSGGTAVGVDPSSGQAYFTTCDTANLSRLLLWNGVGLSLTATIGLPGALTGNESFAVALDPTTHVAYVSNGANSSEIDAINGPGAPQSPQLSLSVNGAANQALDAAQTIAFGDVANGTTSAASSLEITNSGTTTAAIGAPLLLGTGFAITTDSCALGSLAPTAVCDTGVAFKPTAATSYHGGLAYLDSERDTPQLVGLSGTGTGSSALIITPTSLPAGYVDESYPLSGVPIQFDISGGSFPVTANLCQTLASGKAGTLCCPVSESTLGPSCPAGLLPNGLSLAYNSLSGTPAAGSAGTYLLTLTASDASGDKASQNYTLVINPAIAVSGFKLSATTIVGGAGVTATVTLGEPAPGNGAYVSIESSDTAAVPSLFAFIAPGQTTVTVPVPTNSVSAVATVTLTADFSDSTATATLTVDPVGTASVSINLSEVVTVSDAESFSDLVDDESITVSDKVTLSEDVPDVVGDVSSTAITDLTTVGLTIGTITYVYNDSVPAGEVISQSPGPTTTDSSGVTVSLVISRGPPPTATIPETVGVNDTVTISAITPGIQIALAGAPTLARSASGISVTVPLRNTGNVGARTVVETGGTLNGVTQLGSPAPVALAAGATRSVTVRFPLTGTAGEIVHLAVAGTYAGATVNGKWGVGARVVLP